MSDIRVKIFGAGSIGNHLAYACRSKNWQVTICDLDSAALERTRTEIYPSRYGQWDDGIALAEVGKVADDAFDVVIVGTPPDSHMAIALDQLARNAPRVMMIEKPLCPPDMRGCSELKATATAAGTFVGVGYNHTLTKNTQLAEDWLRSHSIGDVATIRSKTREHWRGIFGAHPWLAGPQDTYLGFTNRGGGAVGEHSHAINIWQHFAHLTGHGRIVEVSAALDMVEQDGACYDRIAQISARTETGLLGTIVQDVITEPAKKWLRVQGSDGFVEWEVNCDATHDAIRTRCDGGSVEETLIEKNRPDDFQAEIEHIDALLNDPSTAENSPVSLERGLDTMLVIAAAIKSSNDKRTVAIDPAGGDSLDALRTL
jgi:predicted dehydrogenase